MLHRWLDRCLRWHADHGPADQAVYGIVQGGVYEDLRRESAAAVASSTCDGIAIGGSLGQDKEQMYDVVAWTTEELERGGYVLRDSDGAPQVVLIGTGSEVSLCLEAADRLAGEGVAPRVVSTRTRRPP